MGDARIFFILMAILAGIPLVIVAGVFILIPTAVIMLAWALIKYLNRPQPITTPALHAQSQVVLFPEEEEFGKHFMFRLRDEWQGSWPIFSIFSEMCFVGKMLYDQEGLLRISPQVVFDNPVAEGRYRDRLLAYQKKAENAGYTLELVKSTLFESVDALYRHLPVHARTDKLVLQEPAFSIPLRDVLPNVGKVITDMVLPFYAEPVRKLGLFQDLRAQLSNNQEQASGGSQLVMPEDYDGDDVEWQYLKNTPFADIFDCEIPFELGQQRYSGMWVCSPPGRGKSTLLLAMFAEDMKRDASIVVFDSKGDLINVVKNLKQLEDRYIIIDPTTNPIAINPLDIAQTDITHAVDLLEYLFSAVMENKLTATQSTLFRSVLRSMITTFPEPNLETFRDILQNGVEKYKAHIDKCSPDLKDFFAHEFNDQLYRPRRMEVLQRIRYLLENDAMRAMLLAPRTRFDLGKAMNEGKIIIIDNSRAILGDAGSEFFSRFFLAQLLAAGIARSRSLREKKPCYVYIDEAASMIHRDEKLADILDTLRSQNIAVILAHQRCTQIHSPNVLDALTNCAIRYANSDDDARFLAPRLRTTPEFLQSLKIGEFAAYVRDLTPRALKLSVTPPTFGEKLTPDDERLLTERMRAEYGVPASLPKPEPTMAPEAADSPTVIAHTEERERRKPSSDSRTEGASDWR